MVTVLIVHEPRDKNFIGPIRQCLSKLGVDRVLTTPSSLDAAGINLRAMQFKANYIFIANMASVQKILTLPKPANAEEWAGTKLNWEDGFDLPTMICLPLYYWHGKSWGSFVMEHHFRKFLLSKGGEGFESLDYANPYVLVDKSNAASCLAEMSTAIRMAIDIETTKHIHLIMVGYCARLANGSLRAYIVDIREDITIEQMEFIRAANLTTCPKIFHNGTYDNQYFARWRAPVRNYILDTEYLFYAMYTELPRSLAFVAAFYSPVARFWKGMSTTNMAKYCALDCFNTLTACEIMLEDYPAYALVNYAKVFQLITPALFVAMHGLNINPIVLLTAEEKATTDLASQQAELNTMCGIEVNVNSPNQMKALLYGVLAARKCRVKGKIGGTDETTLAKLAEQHPLVRRFTDLIIAIRGNRKAISTYYSARLFHGRLLYSYRVDGTETNRLACKKSNFGWGNKKEESYGAQVQNIPGYMKEATIPDPGYAMGECDKSQAEARCTAYLANDKKLVAALEGEDDFYVTCGMLFFEIPYETVLPMRQLVKKIIHGSNYMMGPDTFIDSVRKDYGTAVLYDAMKTLNRDPTETLVTFAAYLLDLYRSTYDRLPEWYKETKLALILKGELTSPLGAKRIFFGDPNSDNTLRAAVAHQPQNLSVDTINQAFVRAFWKIQIPSKGEFKLIAQVHDSIVYQCILGKEQFYQDKLKAVMAIEVAFPETSPTHPMSIPVDGGYGACWKVCH